MSKAEIIAELSHLSSEELAEVQARLDELAGEAWQDRGELSDSDKNALDAGLAEYEKSPNAGSSWDEVKAAHPGQAASLMAQGFRVIVRDQPVPISSVLHSPR